MNISGNTTADKQTIIPTPPMQNCQSTESTLHCPISPMRTHLKWSTNRNIAGNTSADKLTINPPPYNPLPPYETARTLSQLCAASCHQ